MYNYFAQVLEVIDGDTLKLNIDLGFDIWHIANVRLNGINCAEKNTDLGKKAKDFVSSKLLPVGTAVHITTYKPEKYGRMLVDVRLASDLDTLNKILVDNNLAVPYDGHGPRPVPKG